MRLIAILTPLALMLAAAGCEPVADRTGPDDTIATPDATTTDTSVPDPTVPDATVPDPTAEPGEGTYLTPDTTEAPSSPSPAAPDADSVPPATPRGEESSARPSPTEPDNTAKNERDADGDTKTPVDQGLSDKDTKITAEIRQQVLEIKGASINARNVKIVTTDGKVTLRGPVESAEERDQIEDIATKVAGEGNVENQLEVKTE